jgi:DinB superfamily
MDIQTFHTFLAHIRTQLQTARGQIDAWFEAEVHFLDFVPAQGGWNGREVLEHVVLTQHFLLKLIDKAGEKALRNINQLELAQELAAFAPDWARLERVGLPSAFVWPHPEHMEPTGTAPLERVRADFHAQIDRCLAWLDQLPNGEGVLYRTTMSVQELGKITVYEYLLFLALHALRHGVQLEGNRQEFLGIEP